LPAQSQSALHDRYFAAGLITGGGQVSSNRMIVTDLALRGLMPQRAASK
jgi:hypothetical protein